MEKILLKKRSLKISNLPNNLSSIKILSNPRYLGKYGKIRKLSIFIDNTYNNSISAYVSYEKIKDAATALISLESLKLDNRILCANYLIVNYCQKFLHNKVCKNDDCIFLHKKINENEIINKDINDESSFYYLIKNKNFFSFNHVEFALQILNIRKEIYFTKILPNLINFHLNKTSEEFPCFLFNSNAINNKKMKNEMDLIVKNKTVLIKNFIEDKNINKKTYRKRNKSRFDFAINDTKLNDYSIKIPDILLELIDKNIWFLLSKKREADSFTSITIKKINFCIKEVTNINWA